MTTSARLAIGALAGLLSALCAVGVSMLVAAWTAAPSATSAVANRFVRMTPEWLKEFAIENFGTNDKLVLKISVLVTIGVLAIVAGLVAWRSRTLAVALTAALGLVAVVAAATDPTDLVGPVAKVAPSFAALVAAVAAMLALSRPMHATGRHHA